MAKERVDLDEKKINAVEKFFEELDENDDIQDVYSNLR